MNLPARGITETSLGGVILEVGSVVVGVGGVVVHIPDVGDVGVIVQARILNCFPE